jgi:hypothetical protein
VGVLGAFPPEISSAALAKHPIVFGAYCGFHRVCLVLDILRMEETPHRGPAPREFGLVCNFLFGIALVGAVIGKGRGRLLLLAATLVGYPLAWFTAHVGGGPVAYSSLAAPPCFTPGTRDRTSSFRRFNFSDYDVNRTVDLLAFAPRCLIWFPKLDCFV